MGSIPIGGATKQNDCVLFFCLLKNRFSTFAAFALFEWDVPYFFTFFEHLCTVNELESLAQRFEVASMLYDKHTYLEVADKTGASTATISRVNRSLNYGSDGYDMVFKRMKK